MAEGQEDPTKEAAVKKSTGIFAAIILALAICAIKFSHHPIAWLIGIAASIPIFAAISGGLLKANK
jgi:hypothetical protein